jgi:hypothetical protein
MTSHDDHVPSRRRQRLDDVVTLRVHIALADTNPPLWRQLDLASDLFLDQLHDILQTAFGWTDSHLHQFGCGPKYYSDQTEYYLCPFSVEDGEEGIPEEEVRLDEVLVDVGDILFYNYDFGDDWEHVIRLESVASRDEASPRAVCIDGAQPGPAEDSGGVHGYELFAAATDPTHTNHSAARAEIARIYGPEVDPQGWAPTPFAIDDINRALADFDTTASTGDLPGPLRDVLTEMNSTLAQRKLRDLAGRARLHDPVLVDAAVATAAVRQYTWLLHRVGDDGIKLSQAGYLPSVDVAAAITELELDKIWTGRGNREHLTAPVMDLRESAQRIGLLRKRSGRIYVTALGRALRDDPIRLWRLLAEQTPPKSSDPSEHQAGVLLLAVLAAGITEDINHVVADLLNAIGWTVGDDNAPLGALDAGWAARPTKQLLRRLGLFQSEIGPARPTAVAVTFARTALTTWP